MNILQILPELSAEGGETGVVDLAGYLFRGGHKAVVVSSGGELSAKLRCSGAVHYRLPVHKKSLALILYSLFRLLKIIRKEKIDIVHARSRLTGWIAFWACRLTGRIFVTTCHEYYPVHPFNSVMGWGRSVIVASRCVEEHMREDFRVPQDRIRFIPRGVNCSHFHYESPLTRRKPEQFRIGMIGRITPRKGHFHFFSAMAEVSRVIPGLSVRIVGDAPPPQKAYKKKLLNLVQKLKLDSCVEFLGIRRDIPAILSQLDVLVLSHVAPQAFGRVILEAQAAGVPVIATNVGGVVDIIEDEKTGLLVAPANARAIAEAVVRLYEDPDLGQRLADQAYQRVKQDYPLHGMVEKTLKVYEDVLGKVR